MSDKKPITIASIPAGVRLPWGSTMRNWLRRLDKRADAAAGRSADGKFTESNFKYFQSKSLAFLRKNASFAMSLKRYGTFAAFKASLVRRIRYTQRVDRKVNSLLTIARTSGNAQARFAAMRQLQSYAKHPGVVRYAISLLTMTPRQVINVFAQLYGKAKIRFALMFKPSLKKRIMTEIKTEALDTLASSRDQRAMPIIVAHLKHRDGAVRYSAMKALDAIYTSYHFFNKGITIKKHFPTPIIQRLLKDPSSNVRLLAARVLGMIKDPASESARSTALVGALNDRDGDVISTVMSSLTQIGSRWVIRYMVPFLQDRRMRLRVRAIEVLGYFRYAKSTPALITLLNKDPSSEVRATAARALGRLNDPRAKTALRQARMIP